MAIIIMISSSSSSSTSSTSSRSSMWGNKRKNKTIVLRSILDLLYDNPFSFTSIMHCMSTDRWVHVTIWQGTGAGAVHSTALNYG